MSLFIRSNLELPEWLHFRNFDDLKLKLVGVVIVVLAVLFLGHVVAWNGERDLLRLGAAIALVIAALDLLPVDFQGQQGLRSGAAVRPPACSSNFPHLACRSRRC